MPKNPIFAVGEYYHLYNRGIERRDIFLSSGDYQRFSVFLHLLNNKKQLQPGIFRGRTSNELYSLDIEEKLTDIGAYCLMPNHFHLLVREKINRGISLFMQKLLTGYTMYFNKKNNRTGRLFESKFKAKHADKDEYLKYLFSYIHLNPVKLIDPNWKENSINNIHKAKNYLDEYRYSSYLDYVQSKSNRKEAIIISKEFFPDYFSETNSFNDTIDTWLYCSRFDLEQEK